MLPPTLLTDPFLQLPASTSVRVVWFTEFVGMQHTVSYGEAGDRTAVAHTVQLSRTREDADSNLTTRYTQVTPRPIWRHEAEVTGLVPGDRLPYWVTSVREDGASVTSQTFTLAAAPSPGQPLKILLTSDHQLKPMAAANLQKVVETIGQVDAVFFAGDLVNVPDRASEWFDDAAGGAFFPVLQGRASYDLEKNGVTTRYRGGAVIQHAPLYAAIGNHEVMGRFSSIARLNDQFYNTAPRAIAEQQYRDVARYANPTHDPNAYLAWIHDYSFNTGTYEEILTLPQSQSGGKRYYAVTVGDVHLITLYITNVWRSYQQTPDAKGKWQERQQDLHNPDNWGYGQHLFEAITPGSAQHTWLVQALQSEAFQQAKYTVVMFHHPPHSLGENSVPAYTDPVQQIDRDDLGRVTAIRYHYPKANDYILRDVVPLLEQAGVDLVLYGHSHLWNRFTSPTGMHFLETSNVGNSYGAYLGNCRRHVPDDPNYAAIGNPNGLPPQIPTVAPLRDKAGQPLPYIASNDITVFSVLDTATGQVCSYYFDTRLPESEVVLCDRFSLGRSSIA